jgi:L-ascorbate metabolism protein UlaG (beta-lactamase superfamily)
MGDKIGAEVWYLFNSGFAVSKGERFFIFDYYEFMPFRKQKGLSGGVINPEELKDLNVMVFASHAHMDHFVPAVLKWGKEIPNLHYVLSYDIDFGKTERVTKAFPNASYEISGVSVRTLKSTDAGVAFIAEFDGLKIYHAGDLNWWHWDGEPEDENRAMGDAYKAEIDKIKGETFDLAFIPLDPRLEKEYLLGLDYFMKNADARVIFPMHFRSHYSVFDTLAQDPAANEYRSRVLRISRRGERFEV